MNGMSRGPKPQVGRRLAARDPLAVVGHDVHVPELWLQRQIGNAAFSQLIGAIQRCGDHRSPG
jgi:hypothetical protein